MRTFLATLWFALAIWFWWGADSSRSGVLGEIPRTPEVAKADIDRDATRTTLSTPPLIEIGGVLQKCSDCHSIFASLEQTPGAVRQHTHLVHDHGMNDACFNCHSRTDHNRLELRDGREIEFSESVELCAQCHGTLYRDWLIGGHGKTRGSWDESSGEQWRMTCVECHEPHAPAFPPMKPLPGPNTWRMGPVGESHGLEAMQRNPLERWKLDSNGAHEHESEDK